MNVLRYANRVPLQFQAGGLRHHADRDGDQLAGLRPEPVARLAAQRPGHRDGPHGQRVGAVHQRVEGGRRLVSRDSEGAAAGPASGRPQAGHVSCAAGCACATKASGATCSSATSARWPRPSAASTAPTATSSTSSFCDVAKKRTAEADVELDDRGKPIEEDARISART